MIIISRCPYRISLLGGGSDLDWFVKDNIYGFFFGYKEGFADFSNLFLELFVRSGIMGTLAYLISLSIFFFERSILATKNTVDKIKTKSIKIIFPMN